MKICLRILAGLTFLLSAAMLLLSLAGGVGVWIIKEPVTAKATYLFGRIEAALDVAEDNLDEVKASLTRASERLNSAREEQRTIAKQPQPGGALRRTLARKVQRTIAPELGDAHDKLHNVAEAAFVVNSVLEDVGNFPFLSAAGLDVDNLKEMNGRLAGVAPAAWELSRLFGEPQADAKAAGNELSRIQRNLKTMQSFIAGYQSEVTQVRQRTEELKARTLPRITPAAVVISAVCFWVALSQVSLLCHAWSWWRRAGNNPPPRQVG
jgi:hypothetical protein